MSEKEQHSRTYSWLDPDQFEGLAAGKSGMEYMQLLAADGLRSGPFWQTMGVEKFEVLGPGETLFTAQPQPFHYNIIGTVHGGFTAGLLDSALGTAVHTMLPEASKMTTVQIDIHFVRPVTLDSGMLRCTGKALHVGRRMATAEARLVDAEDKLCAHASGTMMIF